MTNAFNFNFDTTYTSLPKQFFVKQRPERVQNPMIVHINYDLAQEIGLNLTSTTQKKLSKLFSGNELPDGSTPLSQAYAGHQFGYFTMLGDGRAHLLGEHITPNGIRLDIQLKGSGKTPYSRSGDGRAALGPMIREYLISEAMYYLGIPTTRSLAIITTGQEVRREALLPGSILTRIASSHIRVGTFEFAANQRDEGLLKSLLDYTIKRHCPEVFDSSNKAVGLIENMMQKQSDLIVHWMRVGFIHGVMNTDNMTLSGETIDYGPCAFMDNYDPNTFFSSIDRGGRYSFMNQPLIAQWNLARLIEALLPLIDNNADNAVKLGEKLIDKFSDIYKQKWLTMMRSKIGLFGNQPEDQILIKDLLDWMHNNDADFTNTFRDLSDGKKPTEIIYETSSFQTWYKQWKSRLQKNSKSWDTSVAMMRNINPIIIPRNHQVERVISAAAQGDFKHFRDFLVVLKEPFKADGKSKPYQIPPEPRERVYQTFCGT